QPAGRGAGRPASRRGGEPRGRIRQRYLQGHLCLHPADRRDDGEAIGNPRRRGEGEGMSVNKQHREFHTLDLSTGWETPAGYPKGIAQKILSGALDEAAKRGTRTRLLRFQPGEFTTA